MTTLDHPKRPRTPDSAAAAPDWVHGEPTTLRRAYAAMRPGCLRPGDRWQLFGGAPAVKALVHTPHRSSDRLAAILYFHGGGWVVGSPLTHSAITHALCDAAGLELFSVDYRLLPGHSALAPVRDGLAVARRLLARTPSRPLVLAGDSAGAAVALAVALGLETRYRGRLLGVVAFYGGYGLTHSPAIAAHGRREDGLDTASLKALYARLGKPDGVHPFTVAQLSRHHLPPTALFVGDHDPLLADSCLLYAGLRARGGSADLCIVPGVGHSFLHDVGRCAAADETIVQAAKFVAHWHQAVPSSHRRRPFGPCL